MARREIETYLRNEVTWSSQGDLVVCLYERAVRSLEVVIDANADIHPALEQQELGRVVGILVELEAALDPTMSEELATLLRRMYRTMRHEVVQASAGNKQGLEQVQEQMRELLESWRGVVRETEPIHVQQVVDRRRRRRT